MRILVDTNVLLRRAQATSSQHQMAVQSLRTLKEAKAEIYILPQVIYEYWVASTRPISANGLGMDLLSVEKSIMRLQYDFILLKDERGIFDRWQTLVVDHSVLGKTAHDARLDAAMQRHGLNNLLTFNGADFARFPTISVYSPAEILAGRLPA